MKTNEQIKAEIAALELRQKKAESKINTIKLRVKEAQRLCPHYSKGSVNAYRRDYVKYNSFTCIVCGHVKYV